MSRREDEQMALDIVAGRHNGSQKVRASGMSRMAVLSAGLWIAAIVLIALVGTYVYQR